MAATYLTLVYDGVLTDVVASGTMPPCLHIEAKWLYDRSPGLWVLQMRDDDAPAELQAQHVELTFERAEDGSVRVRDRVKTSFGGGRY